MPYILHLTRYTHEHKLCLSVYIKRGRERGRMKDRVIPLDKNDLFLFETENCKRAKSRQPLY